MPAIGWQKRLDEASTLEEVVDVCRDFLVLWKPVELAELGVEFRPAQHLEVDDVNPYALKLLMKMGALLRTWSSLVALARGSVLRRRRDIRET